MVERSYNEKLNDYGRLINVRDYIQNVSINGKEQINRSFSYALLKELEVPTLIENTEFYVPKDGFENKVNNLINGKGGTYNGPYLIEDRPHSDDEVRGSGVSLYRHKIVTNNNEKTNLHEIIHAFTCYLNYMQEHLLEDFEKEFLGNNSEFFNISKNINDAYKNGSIYGFSDEYEFMADILNPALRYRAQNMKIGKSVNTNGDHLKNYLLEAVKKSNFNDDVEIFGLSDPQIKNGNCLVRIDFNKDGLENYCNIYFNSVKEAENYVERIVTKNESDTLYAHHLFNMVDFIRNLSEIDKSRIAA